MRYRTYKAIRTDLDAVGAIKNIEDFKAAVRLVVESQTKLDDMGRLEKMIKAKTQEVSEKCSAFALAHRSVFVNGLAKDGKGVEHGDVLIGDDLYHFAAGYEGLIRLDGGKMTQEFIATLPEKWVKAVLKPSQTTMQTLGVTEDDLHKAGLVRRANNVWSLPDPADAAESGE